MWASSGQQEWWGQRFLSLLENHPWFHVALLSASKRSAGKTYKKAVQGRWAMSTPLPEKFADMVVTDASDIDAAKDLDFVFCAISLDKSLTRELEEAYAKSGNTGCIQQQRA